MFIITNCWTFLIYNLYGYLISDNKLINNSDNIINMLFINTLFTGCRTMLQAYALIMIKKSEDPLGGISELEYTYKISSVQMSTSKIIPVEYKDLNTSEQEHFETEQEFLETLAQSTTSRMSEMSQHNRPTNEQSTFGEQLE